VANEHIQIRVACDESDLALLGQYLKSRGHRVRYNSVSRDRARLYLGSLVREFLDDLRSEAEYRARREGS
jgi:hypothetical protein